MKLLKSKLTALLVALTFTGAAFATTNTSINQNLGLLTLASEGTFAHSAMVAGSFSDYFTFSVGANDGSVWDAFSTKVKGTDSLISLSSELFQGQTLIASGTNDIFKTSRETSGVTDQLNGSYTLHLFGVSNDSGKYFGAITLAAPIPEPGEWALMMSGLGLIGFMVRRRTSSGS